eukprot:g18068.t1
MNPAKACGVLMVRNCCSPWGMSNGSGKTSRAPFQVMGRLKKFFVVANSLNHLLELHWSPAWGICNESKAIWKDRAVKAGLMGRKKN